MKTTKIFLMGILLLFTTTFVSYGDDSSDFLALLTTATDNSDSSTSASTTSLLANIVKYIDPTLLKNFKTAFAADQASASPSTPEGFLFNYTSEHPEFAQAMKDAIAKAKADLGITTDDELSSNIIDQLKKLKDKIDNNTNLTDDQKKEYKDLLDKYQQMAQNMQNQIADANSALSKALDKLTEPQQSDPTMMIMMILMMVMGMLKGGGGCSGGGCK